MNNCLFIIPARGGSNGIPGKNIKLLDGKPLIHYSIEYARQFASDERICVSTDSDEIIETVAQTGLKVPFKRPAELATDTAGSMEVILHALNYYASKIAGIDKVVLLQPTSPLREKRHFLEALNLFSPDTDMVVSVSESALSPYYNLFEEGGDGFLRLCINNKIYSRRQDVPPVYAYNGSIYIINRESLKSVNSLGSLQKIKKYVMEPAFSVDLDTPDDWEYLEFQIARRKTNTGTHA